MRLDDERESGNVEDRRGMGGPLAMGGGVATVIGIVFYLLTGRSLDTGTPDSPVAQSQRAPASSPAADADDPAKRFISKVLASTEDTWPEALRPLRVRYVDPKLVLFTGAVRSACGEAESAMGPFYCPGDSKVYLDLGFFHELSRMGAPGDFAQAYVVAHEVGHHVQNLLGISRAVQEQRASAGRESSNALSVLTELQADCFAGIWGRRAQAANLLDPGDVQQGLRAAAAVGDDRLQKAARGYVVPESFTHGSSAQRMRWFKKGFDGGRISDCDTFGGAGVHLGR